MDQLLGAGQMNLNWKSRILNPLKGEKWYEFFLIGLEEACKKGEFWSYNTFLRGIGNKQNFWKMNPCLVPRKFFLINIIARGFAIGDFNKRGCNPYNTEGTRYESWESDKDVFRIGNRSQLIHRRNRAGVKFDDWCSHWIEELRDKWIHQIDCFN